MLDNTLLGVSPPQKSLTNPCATLYLKRTSVGPKLINTIVHIKNLLQLKGIDEEEIEEIFLQEDEQRLKDVLEKANGKEEFPIIFVSDVYIGVGAFVFRSDFLTIFQTPFYKHFGIY